MIQNTTKGSAIYYLKCLAFKELTMPGLLFNSEQSVMFEIIFFNAVLSKKYSVTQMKAILYCSLYRTARKKCRILNVMLKC